MTNNRKTATDDDRAAAMAAGLRHLAAMIAEHPHLARNLRSAFGRLLVSVGHGDDAARDRLLVFARAGQASGATVTEHNDDKWAGVDLTFGPVSVHVYADVAQVHDVTRTVEYTPRSILAEVETADGGTEMGAVA